MNRAKAFTLIELLIVVAIIAVLAAIAIPNLLEAQIRSKVARVKGDFRNMVTGIEAYRVDSNCYLLDGDDHAVPVTFDSKACLSVLTTPTSYISAIFKDPFNTERVNPANSDPRNQLLLFVCQGEPPYAYIYNTWGSYTGGVLTTAPQLVQPANGGKPDNYGLTSPGPNKLYDAAIPPYNPASPNSTMIKILYDPTNGTTSDGDIIRTGGSRNPLSVD